MMSPKHDTVDVVLSLADRKAFMKLPIEERRRQMTEQATTMVEHYCSSVETRERIEWQGGDIVET